MDGRDVMGYLSDDDQSTVSQFHNMITYYKNLLAECKPCKKYMGCLKSSDKEYEVYLLVDVLDVIERLLAQIDSLNDTCDFNHDMWMLHMEDDTYFDGE